MDNKPEIFKEGNGHNSVVSNEENEHKDSQSLHTSLEVQEDAMDEGSSLQISVSDDSCSKGSSPGVLPVIMTGDLSIKEDDHHEEFRAEEQVAKLQTMDGNTLSDNLYHLLSDCALANQMTQQVHVTERNSLTRELVEGDNSDDMGPTPNVCHQEETLVEQSILAVENCTTEVINNEKVDCQCVCDSSKENNRTYIEAELLKNIDGCMGYDSTVESHNSGSEVEKFGADEDTETCARDPEPSFTEEAPEEPQLDDEEAFSVTVSLNTFGNDVACNEGVGPHIGDSGLLIVSTESREMEDQDVTQKAISETACLVSQESLSVPGKETEKEDCAEVYDGAYTTVADNSQVAKPCLGPYATENMYSFSTVQCELRSIAEAGKGTEIMTRDDSAVNKFHPESQQALACEDEHANRECCSASGIVISTVELSKVALEECIEEDSASYGDEYCASSAEKMGLSAYLPVMSTMSKLEVMNEDATNSRCGVKHTNGGIDIEGKPLSQAKDGAVSSEYQHCGRTADVDGGSSLDSTAGTGQQRSVGHAPAEDEEVSSTGGEDTASIPAFRKSVTQQRKKINIHHQFVREIVKIQHDREQYDREQAERQIQAQQAAGLPQVAYKSPDNKEQQKITLSEGKDVRGDVDKQKGVKDLGAHRQVKDSQQKHSRRNKKPSLVQSMNGSSHQWSSHKESNGSSHQWSSRKESNEQSRQPFLQAIAPKEHVKVGRDKQQHAVSIYRPPVVRESLAAEQRNAGESETLHHQSGAYAINSSPDSSVSSFSDSRFPVVGSPHVANEDLPVVSRSSSGECYGDNIESQADYSSTGTGIKVTFDTEKRQRHIQLSEGPDGLSRHEQVSPAASHSSSGFRVSKVSNFSLSLQDSRLPSGSRQVDLGETPIKGSDRPFRQAATSSLLQNSSSAESSQYRGRAGKSSDKKTEKTSSFFEQADNSANLRNASSRSHKHPPPLIRHGSDGRSGQSIFNNTSRHSECYAEKPSPSSEWYAEKPSPSSEWYAEKPSPSSQGFGTPSFVRSASLGSSHDGEILGSTSFANVRSRESNRTARNMQTNLQHQQFNTPRSHDYRTNQRYAISRSTTRGKKDSQYKNTAKEYGSPFQAMMKDMSRPQAVFQSPAQRSADANPDSKGFGMSWHAKDQTHQTRSQESSQESLRRSQSDGSRKGYTQNLQAQPTVLPSRESLFSTMPMEEKWGDIVDDLTDSYDYLQVKSQGDRESHSSTLLYGASNQTIAGFTDGKASKPVFHDAKQERGIPRYSYKEIDSLQKHSDFVREHSAYETPTRKSVFERLGPQNSFQESILGPPPKMLDNRGVLKASPDALITNGPPVSTYTSFDSGFYGPPQWVPQAASFQHDTAGSPIDEGREVVVQAYTEPKQRRSKRELYVPRRGS